MTACLCPDCSSSPAPTYTPEFRAAKEAEMVAAMPDQPARSAYLAGVEKARGAQASAELRAAARAVFEAMAKRRAA